jgi:alkaline phosphatase
MTTRQPMQKWFDSAGRTLFLILLFTHILQARKCNVIVMIADGWGYNQILATDYWNGSKAGYENWETAYAMSTFMDQGSYNPAWIWKNFDHVKYGATDSGAAATAMAAGVKTFWGAIGLGPDNEPVENLVERAESLGMATGVITSVPWSHATPACFVAHNSSRNNYSMIAYEMITKSAVDVIMGGGHPHFDENGAAADTSDFHFVGGDSLWNALVAGTEGGDADGDGVADPWTLIQTRKEFRKLGFGKTPKRVIGVARVKETLQEKRSGADKQDLPYTDPFIKRIPTLAEMTRGALNVLDNDPDGFFLMIEGGAVDWANHDNLLGRMIEEMDDFNHAFDTVIHWVETRSRWDETLVIVTGDHETGFLTGPGSEETGEFSPVTDNGPGKLPGFQYHSDNHTNSLIPLYAKGIGSDRFGMQVVDDDSVRGEYIDNTAVAHIVFELLGSRQSVSRGEQIPVPEFRGEGKENSESIKKRGTEPVSEMPTIVK